MAFDVSLGSALGDDFPVLVVDDNDDIRESLRSFLEEEGFAVATASSGVEAFERLGSGLKPGLILLDVMMPEMSGLEVLQKLRNDTTNADIPVAVMSGSFDGDVPPPTYFLRKPFELDRVITIVNKHCYRVAA